jgi:hypothetical protein
LLDFFLLFWFLNQDFVLAFCLGAYARQIPKWGEAGYYLIIQLIRLDTKIEVQAGSEGS